MWTVSAFAVVVFGSSVVALGAGIGVLRKRPDPIAEALAVLLFAIAAWAIPHAVSLGYADVERVAFWHRLRYPGTVLTPVAYLVVAIRYAGYEQWLTRRSYAVLAIIPVLTVVAVWTNPYHGLFWRSLAVATVGNATVLVEEYGLWYWIDLGYLYLVTAAGLSLFGDVLVRSSPAYRKQSGLMFLGALVPLATNVVMNAGVAPEPMVDLTTTALAVSGVTFALALFHFDFLELRPVARDRLVENLDDGVVVVGPEGRIRDFNPAAARILGDVAVDRSADEVLPSDGGELVAETPNGRRRFRTRSSTLADGRDREIGRIVYLNDVTDVIEREQRISVLNRVLRHNIRNELNVVSAHLEMLEENEPRGTVATLAFASADGSGDGDGDG
jgi:PAS domain-containing protein